VKKEKELEWWKHPTEKTKSKVGYERQMMTYVDSNLHACNRTLRCKGTSKSSMRRESENSYCVRVMVYSISFLGLGYDPNINVCLSFSLFL